MTDRQIAAIAARESGYMFWMALKSLARAYAPRWIELGAFVTGLSLSLNFAAAAMIFAA